MWSDDFNCAARAHCGSMQQLHPGYCQENWVELFPFSASTCFTNPTPRACLSCAELHLQRSLTEICLACTLERRISTDWGWGWGLWGKTFSKMNELKQGVAVSYPAELTAIVMEYLCIYIHSIWQATLSRATYRSDLQSPSITNPHASTKRSETKNIIKLETQLKGGQCYRVVQQQSQYKSRFLF